MKTQILFYYVVLVALATACGANKTCPGEVYTDQYAELKGRTQATIGETIRFCKGGRNPGKVDVIITDYPLYSDSQIALNTIHDFNENGEQRYDGSCYDNGRKKYTSEAVPIALTSESFKFAKLCYYGFNKTKVAISMLSEGKACPNGSYPQTQPVDDCTALKEY